MWERVPHFRERNKYCIKSDRSIYLGVEGVVIGPKKDWDCLADACLEKSNDVEVRSVQSLSSIL